MAVACIERIHKMELNALSHAFERVLELQEAASSRNLKLVDKFERTIQAAIARIQRCADDHRRVLQKLNEILWSILEKYTAEKWARDVELLLMFERCVELIDECFDKDVGEAVFRSAAEWDAGAINQAIARHLYQEGLLEIGDCFVAEARITNLAVAKKTHFVEMHTILEALRDGDVEPALRWAEKHRKRLVKCKSDIEEELHKLRALSGAEIAGFEKMEDCLLQQRAELASRWTDSFYRVRSLSSQSPLGTAVAAGFQALPQLLRMARECCENWQQLKELPELVNLTLDFCFHSIFVCPILQEIATKRNPPRLLPCGHTISREAEASIVEQNFVLCPYCRLLHEISEIKKLTF